MTNKTILIIDDEIEILNSLKLELKDSASSIIAIDNGRAGLEMVRQHKPTVIISDYYMPQLNGLELLLSLNEEGINIPMIWTTGFATNEIQKLAWMNGVFEIFEKPFNIESLKLCLDAAVHWNPQRNSDHNLIVKRAFQEVRLSIEARKYQELNRLCIEKEISLTNFLNQLIDIELKRFRK